jgi:hypothetical protein
MPLSDKTIHKLANALAPEVVSYIYSDERWMDFMCEMISDAIRENLGDVDQNLKSELGLCIMDHISLRVDQ